MTICDLLDNQFQGKTVEITRKAFGDVRVFKGIWSHSYTLDAVESGHWLVYALKGADDLAILVEDHYLDAEIKVLD